MEYIHITYYLEYVLKFEGFLLPQIYIYTLQLEL